MMAADALGCRMKDRGTESVRRSLNAQNKRELLSALPLPGALFHPADLIGCQELNLISSLNGSVR